MTWILFAFLSALFASLVAIFGKIGTQNIDSTIATSVRSIIMAITVIGFMSIRGGWSSIHNIPSKAWLFIVLSGISGAASWLVYFEALKLGPASKVAVIDRLSVVFTLILAWILLGEKMSWGVALGGLFMVAGALLVLWG
jgi:transporter family protein